MKTRSSKVKVIFWTLLKVTEILKLKYAHLLSYWFQICNKWAKWQIVSVDRRCQVSYRTIGLVSSLLRVSLLKMFTILHRYIATVMMICCEQEWQLFLPYLLSYFPSMVLAVILCPLHNLKILKLLMILHKYVATLAFILFELCPP